MFSYYRANPANPSKGRAGGDGSKVGWLQLHNSAAVQEHKIKKSRRENRKNFLFSQTWRRLRTTLGKLELPGIIMN